MNTFVISVDDVREISAFLDSYRPYLHSEVEQAQLLRAKLSDAVVVPASKLRNSVVAMYSRVRVLDLRAREEQINTLVFPTHANPGRRRISLLSPLGTALLGCDTGSVIDVPIPGATLQFAVREVL
jgi:regulator of nucleoside diphosphate kinase